MYQKYNIKQFEYYVAFHSSKYWQAKKIRWNHIIYNSKKFHIKGDIIILNRGIIVSRGCIKLDNKQTYHHEYKNFSPSLRIHFFPKGNFKYYSSELNKSFETCKNTLFLYGGDLGLYFADLLGNGENSYRLSIDIPYSLLEEWKYDGIITGFNTNKQPFWDVYCLNQNIISKLAIYILNIQNLNTVCDYLEYESIILTFLSKILKFKNSDPIDLTKKQFRSQDFKINQVIDLIHHEFNNSLSIAYLSEKVGLNECYLKQIFKLKTGKTIANYIRDLRMKNAMELILQTNMTLQQISYYIGYKNYANFFKNFKQKFNYLPSEVRN